MKKTPSRAAPPPPSPRFASLRQLLELHIRREGLRWTDQRRVIVDAFLGSQDHVTLDDVLALARKRDRRVGHATVYRTLRLLVECGVADERHFDKTTRFEIAAEKAHHHLICKRCGTIREFSEARIDEMTRRVASRFGFELQSRKLEMYGVCTPCRARPERTPVKRAAATAERIAARGRPALRR